MSYHLLVFAPAAAPKEPAAFGLWFQAQTEWPEHHDYEDPAVATLSLKAWCLEMMQRFPPRSGPYRDELPPEDKSLLADYSIGRNIVFVALQPAQAKAALALARDLAAQHCVGLYEASESPPAVRLPDGNNGLQAAFDCKPDMG
ncbi:hypothetical protein [Comamonas sp. JUb58]|uniref:hypothetical protein n=1 Tax=Comamonas sp. JUb58 TaxID=2485114 RepID=UPI001060BBF9|nr:hypothetical protein [Comamonas sp. JUb58]TDS78087.1 hypothetical protein EDF71_1125 [Comamonas sp. JUb58]